MYKSIYDINHNDNVINVLIACHNRQWNDEIRHWQKYFIETETSKLYPSREIKYMTSDILDKADIPNVDIFSYKPTDKFDMLFLPDCAGEWRNIQSVGIRPIYVYISIIKSLLDNVVKEGGYLYVSKFVYKRVLKFMGVWFNAELIYYYDENGVNNTNEYLVFHNVKPIENPDGMNKIKETLSRIKKERNVDLLFQLKFMDEL